MLDEEHTGHVTLSMENGVFYLSNCEIYEGYRGQHYSVQLLGQAVKYARKHGYDEITVLCGNDLVPYFEKYGFTVNGQQGEQTKMILDIRRVIREIPD